MKIGILQPGHGAKELLAKHGDYHTMWAALLEKHGLESEVFAVVDNQWPTGPEAADAWLVTGSPHGAYEEHAFIPQLEELIRSILTAGKRIVGVCFGHQIIAKALGAEVKKVGWCIGLQNYSTWTRGRTFHLNAYHQDQIVKLPSEADVDIVGWSDSCPYAALAYGDRALTFQAHPEFTQSYMKDLLDLRWDIFPVEARENAASRLGEPLETDELILRIITFFRSAERFEVPVPTWAVPIAISHEVSFH